MLEACLMDLLGGRIADLRHAIFVISKNEENNGKQWGQSNQCRPSKDALCVEIVVRNIEPSLEVEKDRRDGEIEANNC
jgi:hypothetical protein